MIGQVVVGHDQRIVTAALLVASVVAWALCLQSVDGATTRDEPTVRHLIAMMLGLIVVMVAVPPATSTDFNSYAIYGRMLAEYGTSPYLAVPRDFAADPWFSRISYYWSDTASVYGPLFTWLSTAVMAVAGTSVLAARLGFAALAGIALVATVYIVGRWTDKRMAMVAIGLNPLILTYGVNDAHADVVAAMLVALGAHRLAKGRAVSAGSIVASGALVKISLLPAFGATVVWSWFARRRRDAVVTAVAGATVMIAAFLLAGGHRVLEPLSGAASRQSRFSLWNPVHQLFGGGEVADMVTGIGAALATAAFVVFFWWRHRGDAMPFVMIATGLIAYQLFGPYVLSWYAIWALPVAAMALRQVRWPFVLAMAHGTWLALAYLSGWTAIVVLVVTAVLASWRPDLFRSVSRVNPRNG